MAEALPRILVRALGIVLIFHCAAQASEEEHWAFQPIARPLVEKSDAPVSKLAGSDPSKAAQPSDRLLRRVYLDLTGLPPTHEERWAFLLDDTEEGYEKIVDQLLESRTHAEHWARHWMDVWRYTDEAIESDIQDMWQWRDWIVQSLHENKGYDRMVMEMLAGDELAPRNPVALRATGYLARNHFVDRAVWLDSTVDHVSRAFLGITLGCARCHDHKSDPITQKDYYRFRAIFEPIRIDQNSAPTAPGFLEGEFTRVYDGAIKHCSHLPAVPKSIGGNGALRVKPIERDRVTRYPALAHLAIKRTVAATKRESELALRDFESIDQELSPGNYEFDIAQKRLEFRAADLQALRVRIAVESHWLVGTSPVDSALTLALQEEKNAKRRYQEGQVLFYNNRVLELRENLADERLLAENVELGEARRNLRLARKKLEAIDSQERHSRLGKVYPKTSTGRRLALARWIVDPSNPLTARVAVNHIWLRFFGDPLVEFMDDFGLRSTRPEKWKLLDWLACELIESGWDMKHLHRLIVTSSYYKKGLDRPKLLHGEVVRDSLLGLSGLLEEKRGGYPIEPTMEAEIFCRSLYFKVEENREESTLVSEFDGASPLECYRRFPCVTPLQSLALTNHPLLEKAAQETTRRLAGNGDFVQLAFEHILGRKGTAKELDAARQHVAEQSKVSLMRALFQHPEFLEVK